LVSVFFLSARALPPLRFFASAMSFFAVFFALLLEQVKPLTRIRLFEKILARWLLWVGQRLDAGKDHHTWLVWGLTILLPAIVVGWLYHLTSDFSSILTFILIVVVLYLTLGFRQFSHYFTSIRDDLAQNNEYGAYRTLNEWRHLDDNDLPRHEMVRHLMEFGLLDAHRHVFGVFFWFIFLSALGLGPTGAIFYRLAEFSCRYWTYKNKVQGETAHLKLMQLSTTMFKAIDYLPARMTAVGFAIVGNFEEAINGWRRDAALWPQANEGVILAAAAGALGVQLGGASAQPTASTDSIKLYDPSEAFRSSSADGATLGAAPQISHLRGVVGLIWRSMVLWMMLLALLSLANLAG
jgi:adenosylcobinamide-phosphate synthase